MFGSVEEALDNQEQNERFKEFDHAIHSDAGEIGEGVKSFSSIDEALAHCVPEDNLILEPVMKPNVATPSSLRFVASFPRYMHEYFKPIDDNIIKAAQRYLSSCSIFFV